MLRSIWEDFLLLVADLWWVSSLPDLIARDIIFNRRQPECFLFICSSISTSILIVIARLSLRPHLTLVIFREHAHLLVLLAVRASEEGCVRGSRISGRELLLQILIFKVFTSPFYSLLIGRAEGEHEVGWLLLTVCWQAPAIFRHLGRKFLVDCGTIH